MDDVKVLICSVGGTPAPLVTTIDSQRPTHVVYICSKESKDAVRKEIGARLSWRGIADARTVLLIDPQNLLACVRDVRGGVEKALQDMGIPSGTPVVADITGGTKVMSAALSLALQGRPVRYSYVGGRERTKDGVGVVEDGSEMLVHTDNPWVALGIQSVRDMCKAFNVCRYVRAEEIARDLSMRMDGEAAKYYRGFAELVAAYALWDSFDYMNAMERYDKALRKLKPWLRRGSRLHVLMNGLGKDFFGLEAVQEEAEKLCSRDKLPREKAFGRIYLADVVANALRRMTEGRYDDATARLYSVIEKHAKITLNTEHGLDNSRLDLSSPELSGVDADTMEALGRHRGPNGLAKIGLEPTYRLLQALGNPLGEKFAARTDEFRERLGRRNRSLLAHGYVPVGKEDCRALLDLALEFLDIDEKSLPSFIVLDWRDVLYE